MRGKVSTNADDLKFSQRLIPPVVDSITSVRDRFLGPGPDSRRTEPVTQRPALPAGRDFR
jgi:hypothetical protein